MSSFISGSKTTHKIIDAWSIVFFGAKLPQLMTLQVRPSVRYTVASRSTYRSYAQSSIWHTLFNVPDGVLFNLEGLNHHPPPTEAAAPSFANPTSLHG